MKFAFIKILTLLCLLGASTEVYSQTLKVEKAKNYLRWNIFTDKELIFIKRKGQNVSLKTLDVDLFQKISKDLESININKKYFSKIDVSNKKNSTSVLEINLTLKNKFVEIFNFYRDREKKHVLDFWIDNENESNGKVSKNEPSKKRILSTRKKEALKSAVSLTKSPKLTISSLVPNKVGNTKPLISKDIRDNNKKTTRDFRYGAAFIWDYEPISPEIKFSIDLARKTPEFFYKIKNRKYKKDDREAHLQLCINLYRKKRWGLMYKSMKLFEQKYENTSEEDNVIEFLKANAILKDNIIGGKTEPVKTAIAMLDNIVKRTNDYKLKKGIYKYLLNYYHSKKLYIKIMEVSKSFYVDSKENFDYEESAFAAESIIYSLAQMGNYEKLKKVIKEKTIKKIVPGQVITAYEFYTQLKLGKEKKLIKDYESKKSALVKPIDSSILYNIGEAYFRIGKLKKSIELFDEYIINYSHTTEAGRARVRIALAYEMLDDNHSKVKALYKNAMNRTSEEETQLEAKVRYVSLTSVRKLKPTDKDKELRIFLNRKGSQTKISKDMEKLLWQVRLRIFINDGEYDKALAYLRAIPLNRFTYSEKRVFESDGAEVIYGLIQNNFTLGNNSKVVALWNNYNEKYFEKVALDPYLNYLVGRSYIKLGFYNIFDQLIEKFNKNSRKTLVKTYPIWVERSETKNANFLLAELEIIKDIKLENWKKAFRKVNEIAKVNNNNMLNYYKGILYFKEKAYKKAIKKFEEFISKQNKNEKLEDEDYAEFLYAYTDSIYSSGQINKFKKVSNALLVDFNEFNTKNDYFNAIKERIRYLNLEVLASDVDENALSLEFKIKNYLENYKKSNYNNRVEYLLSKTLIKNKKENEAKKLLLNLIDKDGVSVHLKEMAKSELTLIKIKKR